MKFKSLLSRSLAHWWMIELSAALLFLVIVLGVDLWVYRALVARRAEIPLDQLKGVASLDKKSIERAAQSIADHEAFLQNPTLPSISNPF